MITQIEIDGFKTFKDFKVELAPFQVIVGANGSGKSNLFDALRLLSRLASHDLLEAFQDLRGKPRELFTKLPDGSIKTKMRLAVELLLDRQVRDDAGRQVELPYTRLRYAVELVYEEDQSGPDSIHVLSEELKSIPRANDTWIGKYNVPAGYLPDLASDEERVFIGTYRYINTSDGQNRIFVGEPVITVYREGQFISNLLQYRAQSLPRTVLNLMVGPEYLPLSVVRQEMRSWRLIHLNPDELRKPSVSTGPRFLSTLGGNLPTVLAHMQKEDKFALDKISSDLAYMIPEVSHIIVKENPARNVYDIWLETVDHRVFSVDVVSDGTLRLLALAAIKNDLRLYGVLCLEEPENGVNPLNLEKMTHLLRSLVDFSETASHSEPLMQVIVTTHSPTLISQPEVQGALLFAYTADLIFSIGEKNVSLPITLMKPVQTSNEAITSVDDSQHSQQAFTIDQVIEYLASNSLNTAREQLEKAREALREK